MPSTLEVFHGSPGSSILSILREGAIRPDPTHHVYFSARYEDALQHGADVVLRASFAFRAEVTIPDTASFERVSKPGNPLTILVTTNVPLSLRILELYVRLGKVGAFQIKRVAGADAIRRYLMAAQQAGSAQ